MATFILKKLAAIFQVLKVAAIDTLTTLSSARRITTLAMSSSPVRCSPCSQAMNFGHLEREKTQGLGDLWASMGYLPRIRYLGWSSKSLTVFRTLENSAKGYLQSMISDTFAVYNPQSPPSILWQQKKRAWIMKPLMFLWKLVLS